MRMIKKIICLPAQLLLTVVAVCCVPFIVIGKLADLIADIIIKTEDKLNDWIERR